MIILHSLSELPQIHRPVHLALGVFDGIHLGHQTVIRQTVRLAHEKGELAGVLTFEDHPMALIAPEKRPEKLLSSPKHKLKYLEPLGVDLVIILPFTKELAALTASEFLHILDTRLDLKSITVGTDWCFGKNRSGNVDFLHQEGAQRGFTVRPIPPVTAKDGTRISSTAIRDAIARGNFHRASELLGRDHTLSGIVIHGRKLAGKWGFPTANLQMENEQLPPSGVYLIRAKLPDGREYDGIANLGRRPTVEQGRAEKYIEAHLFDFSGDLYNQEIEIHFVQFLRKEHKFPSLDLLRDQIEQDVSQARHLLKTIPESVVKSK